MNLAKESLPRKIMSPVWLLVVIGIGYFIYSLGFMTGFYEFFYNGTSETYDFYKELQVVNHYIFNTSLIIILIAGFCLLTGIDYKKRNWFWIGMLSIADIYLISKIIVLVQTMPYFTNWYQTLDLSTFDTRQSPFVIFQLTYLLPAIAVILIGVIAWSNFRKASRKEATV